MSMQVALELIVGFSFFHSIRVSIDCQYPFAPRDALDLAPKVRYPPDGGLALKSLHLIKARHALANH